MVHLMLLSTYTYDMMMLYVEMLYGNVCTGEMAACNYNMRIDCGMTCGRQMSYACGCFWLSFCGSLRC